MCPPMSYSWPSSGILLLVVEMLGRLDGLQRGDERAQPLGVPRVYAAAAAVHVRKVNHAHVRLRGVARLAVKHEQERRANQIVELLHLELCKQLLQLRQELVHDRDAHPLAVARKVAQNVLQGGLRAEGLRLLLLGDGLGAGGRVEGAHGDDAHARQAGAVLHVALHHAEVLLDLRVHAHRFSADFEIHDARTLVPLQQVLDHDLLLAVRGDVGAVKLGNV
mmetsp:Transcript_10218/g.21312  ORF Transcript_10218/g.21312 Transcript_10218/m.21312 type:complete len:221 (+) Transcript_10218:505-1167(+)